jgi:hypothetical protein
LLPIDGCGSSFLTSGQPGDIDASLRTEAFHFGIAPIAACTRVRSLSIYHPEIAGDAARYRNTLPCRSCGTGPPDGRR